MIRNLKVSITHLNRAVDSNKNLNALTLALIIKMNHVNSVVYDYSIRKLMKTCHCNFAKAKEILEDGLSAGLVYIDGKHLRARKISGNNRKNAVLRIVNKNGEPQIFLKRDNSDLINRLHYSVYEENELVKEEKLELMTEYLCDTNRLTNFLNDGKTQTFHDIRNILLKLSVLHYLRNWRKLYVTFANQYCKKDHSSLNERGMESIDYLNAGISYQAIADRLEGVRISRYQTSQLVQSLIEDGLITSKKSVVRFLDFKSEEEHGRIGFHEFTVVNPRKMKHECMIGHVYLGKGKYMGIFFRRMGNIYKIHDDVWRRQSGYNPKTKQQ